MVNPMVIVLCIGVVSAVFGILLIFAPALVLKAERQANRLFMTDTALINNRIPIGIAILGASAFLGYTYATDQLKDVIFHDIDIDGNAIIKTKKDYDTFTSGEINIKGIY